MIARSTFDATAPPAVAVLTPGTVLLVTLALLLTASLVGIWWFSRRARRAERRLREAERRYGALVEDNGVGMWQITPDGRTIYLNAAMRELLEIETAADLADQTYDRFFTPQSAATIRQTLPLREEGKRSSYEVDLVGRRGGRRALLISGAPVLAEDGELESLIGTCLDITERKAAEQKLAESEARLRLVVNQVPGVLWSTDRELRPTLALGAGLSNLQLPPAAFEQQDLCALFRSRDPEFPPIAAHHRALAGESVHFEQTWGGRVYRCSLEPLRDPAGSIAGCIGFALDISDLRRFESQLAHLAHHDALTGLINRPRFEQELGVVLAQSRHYQLEGALLWCDIDLFKHINESLGHRAGDELLVRVAAALRREVEDAGVVARLGGDEFAILLPHASVDEARRLARRVLEGVQGNPVALAGRPIRPTASIGIVAFPDHGQTAQELLARADLAMYQAKRDGRNRFLVYTADPDWQAQISAELGRAESLRQALESDDFQVYLQPIYEIARRQVTRYELLLRLRTDDGIVLTPDAFLPVAERFGILRDIDRWAVSHAIALIARERRVGNRLRLDVNLSAGALSDPQLLPWIQAELAASEIKPHYLALEITETAAVTDLLAARQFIETLREVGCQFAVDYFGVGFSSFHYLKHLPVDLLKIDGSFIQNLPRDPVNQNLVRAMVEMARGLRVRTVAEYVTDGETLDWLRLHGVDYAQGYRIGKPRPAAEVLAELHEETTGALGAGVR
jgi:diguanylate cyclase (GGDEF)-like protein/PAS domain S-box-containing protein